MRLGIKPKLESTVKTLKWKKTLKRCFGHYIIVTYHLPLSSATKNLVVNLKLIIRSVALYKKKKNDSQLNSVYYYIIILKYMFNLVFKTFSVHTMNYVNNIRNVLKIIYRVNASCMKTPKLKNKIQRNEYCEIFV